MQICIESARVLVSGHKISFDTFLGRGLISLCFYTLIYKTGKDVKYLYNSRSSSKAYYPHSTSSYIWQETSLPSHRITHTNRAVHIHPISMYTTADLRDLSCAFTERLLLNAVKRCEAADLTISPLPGSLGIPSWGDPIAQFFSLYPAEISTAAYVRRIRKYAHCSNSVYIYALAILVRLEKRDARLKISAYNMHRLLITSVMISAKFLDHAWYSASYYARVGGISTVEEMNGLEITMLRLLDFRLLLPVNEVLNVLIKNNIIINNNNNDGDNGSDDKGKKAMVITRSKTMSNLMKDGSGRMDFYLRKKMLLLV